MGDYTNCLMRGYGVVPSTPTNVRVINIDVNFALVHWDPPKYLKDTVTHYNVHYRQTDDLYKAVNNVSVPKFIHFWCRGSDEWMKSTLIARTHLLDK